MAKIRVVGSVNLDLVMMAPRLPGRGETVTDASFSANPGGKGANQALAALRQGADVELVAAVGDDWMADEALALLRQAGVDLSRVHRLPGYATGVAAITVGEDGENTVVVAPGANRGLRPEVAVGTPVDGTLCQLEIPLDVVRAAAERADGLFCLNAAPARPVPNEVLRRADVIVVNRIESESLADELSRACGLVVVTRGPDGATAFRRGSEVATARPPPIRPVDTVGAGDSFVATLVVGMLDGLGLEDALRRACAAGAVAATRRGAQPSLPTSDEVTAILEGRRHPSADGS